jgi:hypothetical protein
MNLEAFSSTTVPLTYGTEVVSVLWLGQGLDDRATVVWTPVEAREVCLLQSFQTVSEEYLAPYSISSDSYIPGGNTG